MKCLTEYGVRSRADAMGFTRLLRKSGRKVFCRKAPAHLAHDFKMRTGEEGYLLYEKL